MNKTGYKELRIHMKDALMTTAVMKFSANWQKNSFLQSLQISISKCMIDFCSSKFASNNKRNTNRL